MTGAAATIVSGELNVGEARGQLSVDVYGERSGRHIQTVDMIRGSSRVADGTAIYLLDHEWVLLHAPWGFPHAVSAQAEAMRAMMERLSVEARRVLLPIIADGWLDNRSYLIVPLCVPLRRGRILGRWDRMGVTGDVLTWIRSMTACMESAPMPAGAKEFAASLNALQDMPDLSGAIRGEAARLHAAIGRGDLSPAHVPMHGDLWQGNILRQRDGRLAVIDWSGSTINGYAVYDLIRFAHSFRLSKARLHKELVWHSQWIGNGGDGLALHLLGALGHYALRLGEFPREQFCVMAEECWTTFKNAG